MKDLFNLPLIELTAEHINKHYSDFDKARFISIASDNLSSLELKQRVQQITDAFVQTLPNDFTKACTILLNTLLPTDENQNSEIGELASNQQGLAGWIIFPMTEFIGQQGQHDLSLSINALIAMTKRFSSEFGIRYFLLEQPQATIDLLQRYLNDNNHHVRRLISEGTRPRLPWGLHLTPFVKDPTPVLPLLEALKDDESEYVRRSVANHLNDIAKDHPDLVADICSKWMVDADKNRQRLIKHACRTLIKQAHPATLAIFGYAPITNIDCAFKLSQTSIELGESITLTLVLNNQSSQPQKLLIDYVVHHKKANGKLSPKVFKWKELTIASNQSLTIEKQHAIKPITTRKYYSGEHMISIQINGEDIRRQVFDLVIEAD